MTCNILLIVADDLNGWIGALGRNPDVRTPAIDALARRGALFVNAYCSAPYCNASRMGLFTGRLPSTLGVFHNEPFWDAPERPPTFIELLRSGGYRTFGAGKVFHGTYDYAEAGRAGASVAHWREIENRDFLWDEFAPLGPDILPEPRGMNGLFDFKDFESIPDMYHHFDWGPLPEARARDLPDAATVQRVVRFLESKPQAPFFAAMGLYKPHLPWHAPQRFFDLYDPARISLPLVKDDDLDDVPEQARAWALDPPDHELITSRGQWPNAVQGYLAAISYADSLIGEAVAALDSAGLAKDTTIVLCGDNGFHLGEKLHWRKFALWEEATRVPLIIVPPGAASMNRRIYDPVSLIDVFPSLLGLAGIGDIPASDGVDLMGLINGASRARGRPAIMSWGAGNHSLRSADWRYTCYAEGGEELYDHRADPREWTNLAGQSAFAEVKAGLAEELAAMLAVNAPL